MDSPSWLAEDTQAPAASMTATPAPAVAASATATTLAASATEASTTEDKNAALRAKVMKRFVNMLVSSVCAARAILLILTIPDGISEFVIAVYSAVLCAFVFLSEMTELAFMKWILMNHGYLYSPTWRFMFYLLLASMQWSLGGIWSYANGGALVFVAFCNAYWLLKYPSLRSNKNAARPKPAAAADPAL
jgi:hypothetical protein